MAFFKTSWCKRDGEKNLVNQKQRRFLLNWWEINVKEIVNMCGFFLWNITKGLCQKRIECQFISSLSVSKLSSKKQKDSNVTRVWCIISTVDSRLILVSCKSNPCLNVWNMIYLMVMTSLGMSLAFCFNVPFYGWGLVNNKKCLCHVLFPFPFVLQSKDIC